MAPAPHQIRVPHFGTGIGAKKRSPEGLVGVSLRRN
jgi:hypothetical protein